MSDNDHVGLDQMKLRDYLASAAMQGIVMANMRTSVWEVSQQAYKIADAMLEEREKHYD